MNYLTKSNEFVRSQDFKTLLTTAGLNSTTTNADGQKIFDENKYAQNYIKALENKFDEIAKITGFRGFLEADSSVRNLMNDKEVKSLSDLFNTNIKIISGEIIDGNRQFDKMNEQGKK